MTKFAHFYLEEVKKAAPNWQSLWNATKTIAPTAGGAALGGYYNYDPNDPRGAMLGATFGGLGAATGHAAGHGAGAAISRATGKPYTVPFAAKAMSSMWGGAIGETAVPRSMLALQASKENNTSQRLLADAQRSAIEHPPVSAAPDAKATPPVTVNVPPSPPEIKADTSFSLSPMQAVGAGLLSAAAGYALYQHARASKRKADGLEPAPVTNVNVAGGAPGAAPAEGGAPSASAGTLRVTLPTRKAGDNESTVEMPLEQIGLSKAIITKLRRDVKRRLRSESDSRTHRIIPSTLAAGLN